MTDVTGTPANWAFLRQDVAQTRAGCGPGLNVPGELEDYQQLLYWLNWRNHLSRLFRDRDSLNNPHP